MQVVILTYLLWGVKNTMPWEVDSYWLILKNRLQVINRALSLHHLDFNFGLGELLSDFFKLRLIIELWNDLILGILVA